MYLHAKVEVSSITLTSFREGVGVGWVFYPHHHPKPQNEPLKSIPGLGLQEKHIRYNQALFLGNAMM